MFTVAKPFVRILDGLKAARKTAAMWWLEMSDQEQRAILRRGVTVVGTVFAVAMVLPVIGVNYQLQRAEADYRDAVTRLATADSAREAASLDADASSLLEHGWVRSIEYSLVRDPWSSLSRYAKRDRDGAVVASVIDYRPDLYDRAELAASEFDCLTQAVYYEAGNERTEGKLAVAEVIVNRVADHRYPNSVCDVVYQGSTRTTGCQFTFTCDGALGRKPNAVRWEKARTVAAHVLMNLHEERTRSATHYHATYVDPIWNVGLVRTSKIGAHIFYRFPRGAEWAVARAAVQRKQEARARLAAFEAGEADAVTTTEGERVVTPGSPSDEQTTAPAP